MLLRLDFLADPLPDERFALAFDRGVLHVFDEGPVRARFAERIASLLTPGGLWASLAAPDFAKLRRVAPITLTDMATGDSADVQRRLQDLLIVRCTPLGATESELAANLLIGIVRR